MLTFWIPSLRKLALLRFFCLFFEGFDVSLYIWDRVVKTDTFLDYFLIATLEYTRIFKVWCILDLKLWDIISRNFLNFFNLHVFYPLLLVSFSLYWYTRALWVSLRSLWFIRLLWRLPILIFFSLALIHAALKGSIDAGTFFYSFLSFLGERGCFRTRNKALKRLTTQLMSSVLASNFS